MKITRKLRKIGTAFYLPLPKPIVDFLNLEVGDVIIIEDNNSPILKIYKEEENINDDVLTGPTKE